MSFKVIVDYKFAKKADKFLHKAHKSKLVEFVEELSINPVPVDRFDIKKIKGSDYLFRLRLGNYRIFYVVFWDNNTIVLKDIKARENVYK